MTKHLALALISSLALVSAPLPSLAKDPSASAPGTRYPRAGMMGGYGGNYGMGPGMMGGYGGSYGMGPGMMMGGSGYGMGPGMMMGGMGMGPGMMMGGYWGSGIDLTEEQHAKINQIRDEARKQHWALMGEMMDQQARLRDLYGAPKRDQAAIDDAYKTLGKLQQQMYDSSVDAQKRMDAVLTKEQQEKLRTYWRQGPAPSR